MTDQESQTIRREALSSFISAAALALEGGQVRYAYQVSTLAADLGDRAALDDAFRKYLLNVPDGSGRYVALKHYAIGLSRLQAGQEADRYFVEAIQMRDDIEEGFAARMTYADHLIKTGRAEAALDLLNQFDVSSRRSHLHMSLVRQRLIHSLGLDAAVVDNEMEEIRKYYSTAVGLGPIRKLSAEQMNEPENRLGLREARAFAHVNPFDDSRTPLLGNQWMTLDNITFYSRMAVNLAEVLWNEAEGETVLGRRSVGWAIRNRAMMPMPPCDYYPGGNGEGNVWQCKALTPGGPQDHFAFGNQMWSCALHGGTWTPGTSHSQMDDEHVDFGTLLIQGMLDESIEIINAMVGDPTYGNFTAPPQWTMSVDPVDPGNYIWTLVYNWWSGNPVGAQEWKGYNYCAKLPGNVPAMPGSCKVPLFNIHGNTHPLQSTNLCPGEDQATDNDNFFWRRSQ